MLKGSRYANAIIGIVRRVENDRSRALLYVTVNPLEHFKFDDSQHAIKDVIGILGCDLAACAAKNWGGVLAILRW